VDGFNVGESTECFPEVYYKHSHLAAAKRASYKFAYFVAWKQLMWWENLGGVYAHFQTEICHTFDQSVRKVKYYLTNTI